MVNLRIAAILKSKNMTVLEFERRANIAHSTATNFSLNRQACVELDMMSRLCWALEVTPGELFEYTPEEPPAKKKSSKKKAR